MQLTQEPCGVLTRRGIGGQGGEAPGAGSPAHAVAAGAARLPCSPKGRTEHEVTP